jgi:peptidoglycan/xylan/chitin deacetylase (PgdA/CDA1 family)
VNSESTWSEAFGPWPPPIQPRGLARLKRPILRLAAGWTSPSDPAHGIAILAYHATDPDPRRPQWVDFPGQMSLLADLGYDVVTLATAVDRVRSGVATQRPTVAITFDDGWANNLEGAFPELARRGWPATVFLTTSFIGRRPFLDAAEVSRLSDLGITAELHTHTHPDLTTLSDDSIVSEIDQCRTRIESLTGNRPRFFCYPFGWLDRRVRDAVERAGVVAACTSIPGRNRSGNDTLLLRRITPDPGDGAAELRAGLAGGLARLARLRDLTGSKSPSVNPNV